MSTSLEVSLMFVELVSDTNCAGPRVCIILQAKKTVLNHIIIIKSCILDLTRVSRR